MDLSTFHCKREIGIVVSCQCLTDLILGFVHSRSVFSLSAVPDGSFTARCPCAGWAFFSFLEFVVSL